MAENEKKDTSAWIHRDGGHEVLVHESGEFAAKALDGLEN
jgi:hypothetical protein